MINIWLSVVIISGSFPRVNGYPLSPPDVEDVDYWNAQGQSDLKREVEREDNVGVAKNVILFLGDGMGVTTMTAARILKGQLQNRSGEEEQLVFDRFPHTAMIKVYNTDKQGPDSAGTATAFLSGVKTRAGLIGVGPNTTRGNCESQYGQELSTILNWAQTEGKSVGIVTTTRITHATPAAAYAHVADRNWEGDSKINWDNQDCSDIAAQLISNNSDIQVLLGGGRRFFIPNNVPDPGTGNPDASNGRRDGRNLTDEWKQDKEDRGKTHSFVINKGEFDAVNPATTDYLLGLFSTTHMDYDISRSEGETGQPSLTEMTDKALRILQKNSKGYFLLVEGGRIDHGHHSNRATRALYDTLAFDRAVERAVTISSERDTLIVVTADHSHVFTVGGYPVRGNPILGLESVSRPTDGNPMTTLLYGNGPGYETERPNITDVDTTSESYRQQSAVPLGSETHGSEDVTAHAIGPMSHLFRGVKEQNYLAHAMAYAACIGQNKEHCAKEKTSGGHKSTVNFTLSVGLAFVSFIKSCL